MEEPIVFDPPSSNCNCDDIYPGGADEDGAEHLGMPPLDYEMLTDDLSLPENFTFGVGSDVDVQFTTEDLEFINGILSDPAPGFDSASPDHHSSLSHHQQIANYDRHSVSGSPEAECFNPGSVGQALSGDVAAKFGIIHASDPPRVFDVERANSERDSSGRASSQDSDNRGPNLSKASENQSTGSNFKQRLDYQSPESGSCDQFSSQGSGEFNSGVSPVENPPSPDSCQSVPHSSSSFNVSTLKTQNFSTNGLAESRIKIEEVGSKCTPKRKKEQQDEGSAETRTSKFMKSSVALENGSVDPSTENNEDEKKKARLMRNRESAQLSRQRKKQYVEELEDKVKSMHSTITELNSKISYIMAENATLRQQLSGAGGCPPPLPGMSPGMYPMAPVGYPWMPCPPYVVKPQGSQVPLVPIPRLKPQQPASALKVSKKSEKSENKKNAGKTKKVASISFLGLLFFMLLFGGLVPIVNVKYGGNVSVPDEFRKTEKGRIFMVDGHSNETSHGGAYSDIRYGHESGLYKGKHYGRNAGQKEHPSQFKTGMDESVPVGNSSEPLAASLYVPRNDKLVKIDGNLIIHSVLASEKAMASDGKPQMKTSEETRLAIARNYEPSYHGTGSGRSNTRSSRSHRDDGSLQQWFREDLSGSMLSSGMCTEVFQFDVSPAPGSIVPATSMTNDTPLPRRNSTNLNKSRNRRILSGHPIPLNVHALNISKEHVGPNTEKDELQGNKSSSSMVVSVLVDPREAGDGDSEGVMRSKSLSRIFVVVLIDSVKYVTYSCMLPLIGSSSPHLVTT